MDKWISIVVDKKKEKALQENAEISYILESENKGNPHFCEKTFLSPMDIGSAAC